MLGAVLTDVTLENRRVEHIDLATRFGAVRIEAGGYVDASGDASLSYEAGLDVREPEAPVYGSLNFLIEGYDTEAVKDARHQGRARSPGGSAAASTGWCGTTAS